jgi:nucleoside-diphosphate-sugar epimerase
VSDFNDPTVDLPTLLKNSLIYYFVPPPPSGMKDTRCAHFLQALNDQADRVARIVVISTTGVYGDCAGERVDETRTPAPQADRARRRLDMETQLRRWCDENQVALIILRVGGIYGPGRLPLQRIREGVPVLYPELAPSTNRIHADDLADICVAAARVEFSFRIYNVSDGSDSNMTEYFFTLADYFHLPRPPTIGWEQAEQSISKGMLSYLRESRRVDNTRMLTELVSRLRYPDLQAGLATCTLDETEVG